MHDVRVHTQKLSSLQVHIKMKAQSEYRYLTYWLMCPRFYVLMGWGASWPSHPIAMRKWDWDKIGRAHV